MPEDRIALTSSARKELLRLPDPVIGRILPKIENLALEPRPHGCKKPRGEEDAWRICVGDYRVIYSIDHEKILDVTQIAHRREVYQ